MSQKQTIDEVNKLAQSEFVDCFGSVFEESPWVAEEAWLKKPFGSGNELFDVMNQVVVTSSKGRLLSLLRAHPELAGKEADAGTLSNDSKYEQASVGLNQLSSQEITLLKKMNRLYFDSFGFPFIVAVRNHTKDGIFKLVETRLHNCVDDEFANAVSEVGKIASIRLTELLVDGVEQCSEVSR